MKNHFKIIFIFIIFIFINVSKSDLSDSEKSSIDQLISLYNLAIPTPVQDYCGSQYFICNASKTVVNEIYLDGSNIKPTIENDLIFKNFKSITTLFIQNSNILYNTFPSEMDTLRNITLQSTLLSQFPSELKSIQYLNFNDVSFSGSIYLSKVTRLSKFNLLFSTQDMMGDYSIINDLTKLELKDYSTKDFRLYLNSLADFTYFTEISNFYLYLGNNFQFDSFQYLQTIKATLLSIYPGFNTIPIEIPDPTSSIGIASLEFHNINFKSGSVLDLSQLVGGLRFDGCTGLINLDNNDLNIKLGSKITSVEYLNSDLTKYPSIAFNLNLNISTISVRNNKIKDQLPSLPIPTSNQYVLNYDLSDNLFEGEIPQSYCHHYVNLRNNKLSGKLLDCFVCSLNVSRVRNTIQENSFSNYLSGTTDFNQFPKCPGVFVNSPAKIAINAYSYITGDNFGWDSIVIDANGNGYYSVTSKPSTLVQINIPNKQLMVSLSSSAFNTIIQNNYRFELNFRYPNTSTIVTTSLLKPTVNTVSFRAEFNIGYSFSFLGSGLPEGDSSGSSNGNVTIDGMLCVITYATAQFLSCSLDKPQLAERDYEAIIYNSQTNLYGSVKFTFNRVSPWISAVYPAPPTGGLVTMFGSFGAPPYQDVSVEIGKLNCRVQTLDAYTLICNIGAGTGVQNISLTINGTTFFSVNSFRYTDSLLSCPDCGEFGFCDSITGYCICRPGFGGINCQQLYVKDPVITVNQTLVQIIKDGYQFGFRLKDIKEFDINSNIVKTYLLTIDDWSLTPDSTETRFTYVHKVNKTTISYTVEQIVGAPKEFEFAGSNFTLQPGSIKLSASILNWDYLGSLNTLKLQIESSGKSDSKNECDGSSITKNDDGSSINYLSIKKGENILFGRFVDKVLSDSRPTFSSVTVEDQTEDSIIVSLSLPFCKECILDPDFSVLIDNQSTCSSKKAKWIIPTAIVVSLVGFVIILLGVYILLKDKIYISFKKDNFGIVVLKKSRSATSTTMSMSDD